MSTRGGSDHGLNAVILVPESLGPQSSHFPAVSVPSWVPEAISSLTSFQSLRLQGHENISMSTPTSFFSFAVFWLTFQHTSITPLQCCQHNNSTQNDEITSPSQCAESVREPRPKQPTQEPTQESLTAEVFVVLVEIQIFCARLNIFLIIGSARKKVPKQCVAAVHGQHFLTVTRLGSNSQSANRPLVTWNSWNRGSMPDKLR